MKRLMTTIPVAVLAGLLMAATFMPSTTVAGGPIRRLAADARYFGTELVTIVDAMTPTPLMGGIEAYKKTVFVPSDANVLYLTMSTTGDAHFGAGSCFTAKVDGNFFNPGAQGAARCHNDLNAALSTPIPGWVSLLKLPLSAAGLMNCNDGGGGGGDCHDNSIYYQWCTPIKPGTHTVEVRMATSQAPLPVFIEQAFFYVDSSGIQGPNRCGAAPDNDNGDDDDDEDFSGRDR